MVALSFYNQNRRGSVGERQFVEYLRNEWGIPQNQILDLTKEKFWQRGDIDYAVYNTKGELLLFEVKTDYYAHKSGTLIWEHSKESGNEGRLKRCQADYVFYYLAENGEKYLMDLERAREYVYSTTRTPTYLHSAEVYFLEIPELTEKGVLRKL